MLGHMIKRAICNKWMVLACTVSIAIIYYEILLGWIPIRGMIKEPEYYNGLAQMVWLFSLCSYYTFAGMFPGLAYGSSLLEERNSGYLKYIRTRINIGKYAKYKVLFSGLSGGLSVMIPGVMIFAVICLIGRKVIPGDNGHIFKQLMWAPYMYIWGGRFVLLLKAILLFLFGAMWAELALLFSNIFKNRYVAYVLPFLAYELMWLVFPVGIWNPVYLVRSDFGRDIPVFIPYLVDMGYIVILCLINMVLMKRRGRQ